MRSAVIKPLEARIDRLTVRLCKLEDKMDLIDEDIVCNEEDLIEKIVKPLESKMDKIIDLSEKFLV